MGTMVRILALHSETWVWFLTSHMVSSAPVDRTLNAELGVSTEPCQLYLLLLHTIIKYKEPGIGWVLSWHGMTLRPVGLKMGSSGKLIHSQIKFHWSHLILFQGHICHMLFLDGLYAKLIPSSFFSPASPMVLSNSVILYSRSPHPCPVWAGLTINRKLEGRDTLYSPIKKTKSKNSLVS